ncbi:MAG TPA: hypothetical protein VLX28_24570 [Thermoanaerobaculia bacterium]|nr:hypothetical protein [Thermoanaerobaculia bacterium]
MRPLLLVVWLLASMPAHAEPAIHNAMIFDDGRAHFHFETGPDPALVDIAFPFCPTDRAPCDEDKLAWVQLRISIDAYSQQRRDPHDSITHILAVTRQDIAPLAESLTRHFSVHQIQSDRQRVAFVQGLVQAVSYAADLDTGWTEYPKFGIEFLIDEQGDCDDAAILNTLLLEALGYSSYFVHWQGEPSGHLSTAIELKGDLQGFSLPDGSRWIEAPGLPQLLHVDGTGVPGGCGKARIICGAVGFNEWYKRGLRITTVVRSDAPDLESRLSLSAWNNGGLDHPDRTLTDRRKMSEGEIHDEVFDTKDRDARVSQRLKGMGIGEGRAMVYLRRQYPFGREGYYTILGFCLSFIFGLSFLVWYRSHKRRQRVNEMRLQRDAEKSWM